MLATAVVLRMGWLAGPDGITALSVAVGTLVGHQLVAVFQSRLVLPVQFRTFGDVAWIWNGLDAVLVTPAGSLEIIRSAYVPETLGMFPLRVPFPVKLAKATVVGEVQVAGPPPVMGSLNCKLKLFPLMKLQLTV
ncbi:MAG: hypothetical protein EAZ89_21190 [Bacteroidetes bacterium]|nr:MAG: hypothetical protein EAZ89_21190 [Bacteroidota bacterium]